MKTDTQKPAATAIRVGTYAEKASNTLNSKSEAQSEPETTSTRITIDRPDNIAAQNLCNKSNEQSTRNEKTRTLATKPHPSADIHAINNPKFWSISALPAGLTIVCVRDPSLTPLVRNAFTSLALENSSKIGIPLPKVAKVISIYTGNARELDKAMAFQKASIQGDISGRHEIKQIITSDGFDWSSDAGAVVFKEIVPTVECSVILQQQVDTAITSDMAYGFSRFRQTAQQAGACAILILLCQDESNLSILNKHSDELIEIEQCEPDPGMNAAFSIDCHSIRSLNCFGIGKVMCCVNMSDVAIRYHYSPFIAAELKIRAMWILRNQGKTLEEIGNLCALNKSNVSRQLQGLQVPRELAINDGWLSSYLDILTESKQVSAPSQVNK